LYLIPYQSINISRDYGEVSALKAQQGCLTAQKVKTDRNVKKWKLHACIIQECLQVSREAASKDDRTDTQ